jgi:thiol-disulfide isomerase/thioredoxin
MLAALTVVLFGTGIDGRSVAAPPATAAPAASDSDDASRAAQWLQAAFAGQPIPEAAEMLIAIARGSQMGPGDGWFHPGQSRYGWNWLAKLHGVAADGAIAPAQFRGPRPLFDRLDRNHDGVLRADDFDAAKTPTRSPSASPGETVAEALFRSMDHSGDGRLTREEWNKAFDQMAGGKDDLTAEDLRRALVKPTRPVPPGMPSAEVLVRGLFRGEIGSMHEGPRLNDPAPDFSLRTRDGKQTVRLSDNFGKKPIVLTFGNLTCGPFRGTYPHIEEMASRYKDDALFLAVYVREAHPTDGWRMKSNDAKGVVVAQPRACY